MIRPATEADIDTVMAMYSHSRGLMRAGGNMTQWVGYPLEEDLQADIAQGVSYLMTERDGRPVGTFAVVPGEEPTYGVIDHGRWIDRTTPYATVHRMACAPGAKGVSAAAFAFAKSRYNHLRVDTHASNAAMRHIMDREDFVYCGIVYMSDHSERVAYEWWRWDGVQPEVRAYVERYVLPRYDAFDAAHRRDHALRVIARSMMMTASLPLEQPPYGGDTENMVYVAAAMHDLGLTYGREEHHLHSGRIVRNSKALRRWFSDEQIETIAQAVEDHRASATTPPRSPLGCVVAEADRDVEPERIVRRTVEYGISHYPELDREGHWQRTLAHLHEKYADGGYIKLWLHDSPNAEPLAELRALIKDEKKLKTLFDKYYQP